jgi:hypothetical protein
MKTEDDSAMEALFQVLFELGNIQITLCNAASVPGIKKIHEQIVDVEQQLRLVIETTLFTTMRSYHQ